jgi:hypothetical protein
MKLTKSDKQLWLQNSVSRNKRQANLNKLFVFRLPGR